MRALLALVTSKRGAEKSEQNVDVIFQMEKCKLLRELEMPFAHPDG